MAKINAAAPARHLLLLLLPVASAGPGGYVRERSYMGEDFFSRFWFWKWPDLTHGHVEFVNETTARANGLLSASRDRVFIGADSKTVTNGDPRKSVKLFSNDVYNSGLFVITLDHMPTGCGTWPAFWMTGGNSKEHWPSWGEYDIIEGVHVNSRVATALHTSRGCAQSAQVAGRDFTGTWQEAAPPKPHADDCFVQADGQWPNQGCSQIGPENSMGPNFNAQGGGTYAAQWSPLDDGGGFFRTWFFTNGTEPKDLLDGSPNPDLWGMPYSHYALNADTCPQSHFRNMRLVFDLTFCGDMAGASYAKKCPSEAMSMTCEQLVSYHPEAFKEAYWSIRRLETYQWQQSTTSLPPAPWQEDPPQANNCAEYGCRLGYHPKQRCQCDPECLSFGNCCADVESKCGVRKEGSAKLFHDAFMQGDGDKQASAKGSDQAPVADAVPRTGVTFLKRFQQAQGPTVAASNLTSIGTTIAGVTSLLALAFGLMSSGGRLAIASARARRWPLVVPDTAGYLHLDMQARQFQPAEL